MIKVTPMCQRCVRRPASTTLIIAPGLSRILCNICKKIEEAALKTDVAI